MVTCKLKKILTFFRSTDNAAMFKKVVNDDSQLESVNDKHATCLLQQSGLIMILENLRGKTLTLKDISLLDKVIGGSCEEGPSVYSPWDFYPLIHQASQMEILSLICGMIRLLNSLKRKSFFKKCNKVFELNNFLKNLHPLLGFLQTFLVKNEHFDVVLPPPKLKRIKYTQKYY